MIALTLPWPPSVNRYWRTPSSGRLAGRTMLSQEARNYRAACEAVILAGPRGIQPTGRLLVKIEASPPDKRRRDLDNMLKATLDALQHCGVIRDDCDIDGLAIIRRPPVKDGSMYVEIAEVPS